ncbi:hypothetical protein [Intestinibacter bartlettii]|uniref:Uncharacterized protein n=1 Tax=Intestinibacter bartlettii TaxID=261299 RepID=A0ABS6DYH3_9FIRM|nr:hypothetical protein [Intestinibacter bartlettii]MBU5336893.1 hypothetical protein [Intestinibacter bartlettii]
MSLHRIDSVDGDSIEIRLRQLGASKIQKVQGNLYFIKFILEDNFEVMYTYNINAKNKYFLQRIEPYPIPHGTFSNEVKIVDFIKKDIQKFKKGMKSKHFDDFLEATAQANKFVRQLDDFYLNYYVEEDSLISDSLGQINTAIDNLNKRLESIINHSKKID